MKTFHLPDLGEGLSEAEIREWYINEGDIVELDQPLVSMETAKAIVDVPSPYAGKVVKLHGKANEIIQTGSPLISFKLIEQIENDIPRPKNSVVGTLEESSQKWPESEMDIRANQSKKERLKVMPAARLLASQMDVDLYKIVPTGAQGLITTEDVKKHLLEKTSSLQSEIKIKGEVLRGAKRVMAQNMAQSSSEIVPVTIVEDADISHFPKGTDVTAVLLQAMAIAAKAEPSLNAWFDGRRLERQLMEKVNIGVAVDTQEGLFVPVLKEVNKKSLEKLREMIDTFKSAVKNRCISADDMQGATITLSNFGTIVGRYATPIIIVPTVAILGCGRSRETPVINNSSQIVVGRLLPLSLTFDHRAVTGGEASRFLGVVVQYLQNGSV